MENTVPQIECSACAGGAADGAGAEVGFGDGGAVDGSAESAGCRHAGRTCVVGLAYDAAEDSISCDCLGILDNCPIITASVN